MRDYSNTKKSYHGSQSSCNYLHSLQRNFQSFRTKFSLTKKETGLFWQANREISHPIPKSYTLAGGITSISHHLNCLYDCRYLRQGMYPSAHYLMFVNFEDFEKLQKYPNPKPSPLGFFQAMMAIV